MVKPKASWKGLEFCCPVTCVKLYTIVAWLTNPNIIQSPDMIILSYIFLLHHMHVVKMKSHMVYDLNT